MKYNRGSLKKLEDLCKAMGYIVRYEQGHFQAGYCRVESRKVLVINKYFDIEGRMNTLLDLLPELPWEPGCLDEETQQFYDKAIAMKALQATDH